MRPVNPEGKHNLASADTVADHVSWVVDALVSHGHAALARKYPGIEEAYTRSVLKTALAGDQGVTEKFKGLAAGDPVALMTEIAAMPVAQAVPDEAVAMMGQLEQLGKQAAKLQRARLHSQVANGDAAAARAAFTTEDRKFDAAWQAAAITFRADRGLMAVAQAIHNVADAEDVRTFLDTHGAKDRKDAATNLVIAAAESLAR